MFNVLLALPVGMPVATLRLCDEVELDMVVYWR